MLRSQESRCREFPSKELCIFFGCREKKRDRTIAFPIGKKAQIQNIKIIGILSEAETAVSRFNWPKQLDGNFLINMIYIFTHQPVTARTSRLFNRNELLCFPCFNCFNDDLIVQVVYANMLQD